MGFPGRTSFDDLGGTRENVPGFLITDSRRQIDSAWTNEMQWQLAGMNKVSCLVSLVVDAAGQRVSGGEAWNQEDDEDLRVEITKTGTGVYRIDAQAAEYPDWADVNRPVIFYGAIVSVESATAARATYVRNSATRITVYTWDASGVAADLPFTIDIK